MLVRQFFNSILPARAGEVARIEALHRRARASRAETAGTVVLERVFDVLCLLMLLLILLPWYPPVTWLRAAGGFAIGLTIALAAVIVVLGRYGERPVQAVLKPLARLPFLSSKRVARAATNLTRGLAGLRKPPVAAAGLFWTLISWLTIAASYWLLTLGFDLELPPLAGLLVAVATGLGMVIPSAPGAIGVYEAATVVALRAYDVPKSQALSYALVLHAMTRSLSRRRPRRPSCRSTAATDMSRADLVHPRPGT